MSFKKGLKKLLGGLAPTIGVAVGGPMGGIAMKFLADKFTGGDTGKVEDFLLAASPEDLKTLKLAEIEFKTSMRELDIDVLEIAAADRDSARDLAKSKGTLPQILLSIAYSVGYFTVMVMFMLGYMKVPAEAQVMFGGLLGVLSTAQIQIMNFWFGSSAGSKAKTDALSNGSSTG